MSNKQETKWWNGQEAGTFEGQAYDHDCDRCQFKGHIDGRDYWYCARPDGKTEFNTMIIRVSSNGPEYASITIGQYKFCKEQGSKHTAHWDKFYQMFIQGSADQ